MPIAVCGNVFARIIDVCQHMVHHLDVYKRQLFTLLIMVELHQLRTEILFIKRVRAKFALTLVQSLGCLLYTSESGAAGVAPFRFMVAKGYVVGYFQQVKARFHFFHGGTVAFFGQVARCV